MAIYSTFLVAGDRDLRELFVGWVPPLPSPEKRTRRNPFTGAMLEVMTWEPDDLPALPPLSPIERMKALVAPKKRASVVAVRANDYASFLENRLDSRMRELPHVCTKGLLLTHLEDLYKAIGGREIPPLRPARFSPRGDSRMLDRLPDDGVRALAGLSREKVGDVAAHLAGFGAFDGDGWSAPDVVELLTRLQDLASKALLTSRSLLLFVEC